MEWCTAKENIRHSWKNGLSTPYWKNKFGKENPKSIKINQYDKNGNFIKTWESINMAARKLNIDCGRITKCCKKYPHCKTAGGFIWEYYTN